ncbi:hypothetical protein Moror_7202 [Moniliophthora roreri MCA 2997]|uniref:DRBM domain-containing protein n=2 Tax=Moniliophthora roreri TaxID=221103 RepID=V2XR58_MONRO|nr:hypothetical protein Moror_7202 [Moniliophthora roreri MCA 2997]KAI3622583.1 hypothetical protein WG66_015923 [Moniliophthora roreri]
MAHPRTDLNNHLQRLGRTAQWTDSVSGPKQAPTWTSTVYIDGMAYGSGQANTKGAAQDLAAQQALDTLQRTS